MGKLLCHKPQFETEFLNNFFSQAEELMLYSTCFSLQKDGPVCFLVSSKELLRLINPGTQLKLPPSDCFLVLLFYSFQRGWNLGILVHLCSKLFSRLCLCEDKIWPFTEGQIKTALRNRENTFLFCNTTAFTEQHCCTVLYLGRSLVQ